MIESSSSDSEFWENLCKMPCLNPKTKQKIVETPAELEIQPKIVESLKKEWKIDKDTEKYKRITEAHSEETRALAIKVTNKTKKKLFSTVKNIVYGFQQNISEINENNGKMKESLLSVTRDHIKLEKKLKSQDRVINKHNIEYFDSPLPDFVEKNNVFQDEISVLTPQLACLREVAAEFNKDLQTEQEKVLKIKSEINQLNLLHKQQVEKLRNHYETKEFAVIEDIDAIKQNFENYKKQTSQELELREIIVKRQKEFISKLYSELGNSKFIFKNPRLRQLLHLKSQTKEEIEEVLPLSSYAKKRIGVSTRGTKYSENESLINTRPGTRDLRSLTPYK